MKKILLLLQFLFLSLCNFSQSLSQIILTNKANAPLLSFFADQNLIIHVSTDGIITQWGTAFDKFSWGYYPGKLQGFVGRTEYYANEADEAYRGKIKSLGNCSLTYYASYENSLLKGKVKSIGNITIDYFADYEDVAYKGKIKNVGWISLNYYGSFDNIDFYGKLKSINNTTLNYYTSFDDALIKGNIKSIGTNNYTWYTSFDKKEYQGLLKSGNTDVIIGGINYIVKFF